MNRKIIICLLTTALLSTVPFVEAQQAKKVPRIGYLSSAAAEIDKSRFAGFQEGLRELGYVESKHIVIEKRYTAGQTEKLSELAMELVGLKADVLVVHGGAPAVHAAKKATSTIPIVMIAHPDPVGDGLIASLARPGGQVTGLSDLHSVLVTKRLELMKDVVPSASRVAVLLNPTTPTQLSQLKDIQAVAPGLGVTILSLPVTGPDEIDRAFTTIRKERPGGLVVLGDPLLGTHRKQIFDLAAKSRLPAFYSHGQWVEAGGLMSYGAHFPGLWRRAATYVDKILKGSKPADLPVEQPTKFEFVINLKTAKQIGLTIPPNVLARADRVIK